MPKAQPEVALPAPGPSPQSYIRYERLGPLLQILRNGTPREKYISQLVSPLRSPDIGPDGLDQSDIDWLEKSAQTKNRANRVQQLLRSDFNGDWNISDEDKIESPSQASSASISVKIDEILRRFDHNGNGVATLEEARAESKSNQSRRSRTRVQNLRALLALDPNKDGRLSVSELTKLAEASFDRYDKNGNGLIDTEENEALAKLQLTESEAVRMRESGCDFARASKNAKLIFVGSYSGKRLSTSYVGFEDIKTTVIDVEIEAGSEPLYLFMGSYDPIIWRFSGATKRIEHAVFTSFTSANHRFGRRGPSTSSSVGSVGLPPEKVNVVGPDCLRQPYSINQRNRGEVDAVAQIITGGSAEFFGKVDNQTDIALPSLISKRIEPTGPPTITIRRIDPTARWKRILREELDDIAPIDPKSVVATEPVGEYTVLPGHYGIAQMVKAGALEEDDKGRLRIVKNIVQWPLFVGVGSPVAFIATQGVDHPQARPRYACVLTEEEADAEDWIESCRNEYYRRSPSQRRSP